MKKKLTLLKMRVKTAKMRSLSKINRKQTINNLNNKIKTEEVKKFKKVVLISA